MRLVDSHAHLDDASFEHDLDAVLENAAEAGVHRILTVGCLESTPGSAAGVQKVLDRDPERLVAAFGVHPHDARHFNPKVEENLVGLLQDPRAVALGEIGLDYYYDNSPRDAQTDAFCRQLQLAKSLAKPVVIHTREAEEDTLETLRQHFQPGDDSSGVLHCYTGSWETAAPMLERGFYFSIGGIVTFKKADQVRNTFRRLPLDRILLETDAPYLAPVPRRGKRNEPALVRLVAETIAELREIPLQEVAKATTANFERLFLSNSGG